MGFNSAFKGLTDECLLYCLHLCVSNYRLAVSKLSQDANCHASALQQDG